MKNCPLCQKCTDLLEHWSIPFVAIYDNPKKDRQYPYVKIEYEYKELVDLIGKGML